MNRLLALISLIVVAFAFSGCGAEEQKAVAGQEKIGKPGEAAGNVAQSPDTAVQPEN